MDLQAEKLRLIEWLAELNDIKVLNEFITLKKTKEVDWWDEISQEERLAIDEGIAELDRGEGIPHEEVMRRVKEKFNL